MTYVGRLQRFVAETSPWWLRGKILGSFLESVALTYDTAIDSLSQGLALSQPLKCDSSALPVLSHDRGIRVYPNEPLASQRYRLSQWWPLHRQRGTHQGTMRHVQPYFLPGTLPMMRIVHQDGNANRATWHTLDESGDYSITKTEPSNWNFDGVTWKQVATITNVVNTLGRAEITTSTPHGLRDNQSVQVAGVAGATGANGVNKVTLVDATNFVIPPAPGGAYSGGGTVSVNLWSRWWAIIYPPPGFQTLGHYDDGGAWDDGRYWDGIPTDVVADLVAMTFDWRAAHSALWGVIVTSDPTSFDPTSTASALPDGSTTLPVGNWGFSIDNTTGVPTRPPFASFLYDKGQA